MKIHSHLLFKVLTASALFAYGQTAFAEGPAGGIAVTWPDAWAGPDTAALLNSTAMNGGTIESSAYTDANGNRSAAVYLQGVGNTMPIADYRIGPTGVLTGDFWGYMTGTFKIQGNGTNPANATIFRFGKGSALNGNMNIYLKDVVTDLTSTQEIAAIGTSRRSENFSIGGNLNFYIDSPLLKVHEVQGAGYVSVAGNVNVDVVAINSDGNNIKLDTLIYGAQLWTHEIGGTINLNLSTSNSIVSGLVGLMDYADTSPNANTKVGNGINVRASDGANAGEVYGIYNYVGRKTTEVYGKTTIEITGEGTTASLVNGFYATANSATSSGTIDSISIKINDGAVVGTDSRINSTGAGTVTGNAVYGIIANKFDSKSIDITLDETNAGAIYGVYATRTAADIGVVDGNLEITATNSNIGNTTYDSDGNIVSFTGKDILAVQNAMVLENVKISLANTNAGKITTLKNANGAGTASIGGNVYVSLTEGSTLDGSEIILGGTSTGTGGTRIEGSVQTTMDSSVTANGTIYFGSKESEGSSNFINGVSVRINGAQSYELGSADVTLDGYYYDGAAHGGELSFNSYQGVSNSIIQNFSDVNLAQSTLKTTDRFSVTGANVMMDETSVITGSGKISESKVSGGLLLANYTSGKMTLENSELTSTAHTNFIVNARNDDSQVSKIIVSGTLLAGGTLELSSDSGLDFLTLEAGDVFQLFDILQDSSIMGSFENIVLPALSAGLEWDTSYLYSDGYLKVIPEPATMAAIIGAIALAFAVRRRRN